MTSTDLVSELLTLGPGQNSPETRLYSRLLLRFLADNIHDARLSNGLPVRDVTDFNMWLRELADKVRPPSTSSPVNFADHELRSTGRAVESDWCPGCGHIHADPAECGFPMGGAGKCLCDRRVPA
jgi:hypothetical protein